MNSDGKIPINTGGKGRIFFIQLTRNFSATGQGLPLTPQQKKSLIDDIKSIRDRASKAIAAISQNPVSNRVMEDEAKLTGNISKIKKYLDELNRLLAFSKMKVKPKGSSKLDEKLRAEGLNDEAIQRIKAPNTSVKSD